MSVLYVADGFGITGLQTDNQGIPPDCQKNIPNLFSTAEGRNSLTPPHIRRSYFT
jgi:hypothetical protein